MDFFPVISESVPESIAEIWMEAFPEDTPESIAQVWEAVHGIGECLVCGRDGVPVSMLLSIPAQLVDESGEAFDFRYVFAAATRRELRGKGLFAGLLDYAHARARTQGASAMFLHPASDGLFGYYSRLGYRDFFYCDEVKMSADEFAQIGKSCADTPFPQWTPRIEWPQKITGYSRTGGISRCGSARGMYICGGGELFIHEWMADPGDACLAAQIFRDCAGLEYESVRIRRPARSKVEAVPFGMIHPLGDRDFETEKLPYMGLAMDV